MYAIRAGTDEYLVFAFTLFVRFRMKSPCLRVLYSCGCGRIALLIVYAIRADADEKPVLRVR